MMQSPGLGSLSWSASSPSLPQVRAVDWKVGEAALEAADIFKEYSVSLACGAGSEVVGLELADEDPSAPDAGLAVTAVSGGLIERHNQAKPELAVRPGDRLVEVNGYRIPWLLRSTLQSAQGVLRITLRREGQPSKRPAEAAAPEKQEAAAPNKQKEQKDQKEQKEQIEQLPDADIQKVHSAVRWGKSTAEIEAVIKQCGKMKRALASHDPKNGNLVLHIAAQNNHVDISKYLLQKKADINAQNGKGQTALHMTVAYDMYDLTKMFLEKFGASPDIVNGDGHAAITGIDGDKVDAEAWDGPLNMMGSCTTKRDLDAALAKLEAWPDKAGTLDKAKLIQTGMANKKRVGANWDHARFMAVMKTF